MLRFPIPVSSKQKKISQLDRYGRPKTDRDTTQFPSNSNINNSRLNNSFIYWQNDYLINKPVK